MKDLNSKIEAQRAQLHERRILLYEARIYELEMDIVALQAISDDDGLQRKKTELESVRKALEAVKAMRHD